MTRSGSKWVCLGVLVSMLVVADARATRACVGDCNGDGQVVIAELILGVRITLGQAMLSECPSFDADMSGGVSIAELVQAVAAALEGCPATPVPTSSATPTAQINTATPTGSPTATVPPTATVSPTVPMVAGSWLEQPLAVTTSTCVDMFTQLFAADLSKDPCEQMITVSNSTEVTLRDCKTQKVDGTVAPDGTLHFDYPTTMGNAGDCGIALTTSVSIPAAISPTIATYTFAIEFSGTSCPLAPCTIEAQGSWTRE